MRELTNLIYAIARSRASMNAGMGMVAAKSSSSNAISICDSISIDNANSSGVVMCDSIIASQIAKVIIFIISISFMI